MSWECDRDLTIRATSLLQLLWEQVNISLGQALSGYNLETQSLQTELECGRNQLNVP